YKNGSAAKRSDPRLAKLYEDFLVDSARGLNLSDLSLAIDTANGAASGIGQRVFSRLGASVTALSDTPDGRNINERCGATDTGSLRQTVLDNKLDLGVALDGDADRLMLISSGGQVISGDIILYILAVVGKVSGVVATVYSNLGLELALKDKGIDLVRTAVGDHNVVEGLTRTGYKLGGEDSGHIVMSDLLGTGDGLLAAVQTLRAIHESGKDLDQWAGQVKLVPQALLNIPLEDKSLLERPEAKAVIEEASRRLGERGRLLVRPSGTEPLCRIMVEADNAAEQAATVAERLKEVL
ncbi:MAG: phosphoglucosamine mutase, partial [Candidatus Saccharimonadales bacterium]